ncbi:dermonecrotic toxin domain-containing protein [Pseudomonas japonica]|uniref:dermonecrotic toxin domain-containing protein n=1 Tax=Pseudomonas japonica TaxID=256466 RepID=UPI0015E474B7|nr:DUF6543 domain-containing protein [Pseudomonas japonica]MBA1289517.1 hypothetical protein [Pseudomonas japonica]
MTDSSSSSATPTQLAHEGFVTARVPAWLRQATPAERQGLHALALAAETARHRLKQASTVLPQLQPFALEHLRAELASVAGETIDPTQAVVYWVDPNSKRPPFHRTLLEAALMNFHSRDTAPGAWGAGSGLFGGLTADGQPDTSRPLPLTPAAFAQRCRALDIGGRFQSELAQHIPAKLPARTEDDDGARSLPWQVFDCQRKAFETQACVASLKSALGGPGHSLLAYWGLAPATVTTPAFANRLELLGFSLSGVMVFTAQAASNTTQPVVAYVPGDPDGSVRQYANAQAFAAALRARLNDEEYLKAFSRFVPLPRRLDFIATVQGALAPGAWLPGHLSWTPLPLAGDPFAEAYRTWAQQTLAEAAAVAVPTAQLDHRETTERYAHWVQIGEQLGISLTLMVGSALPGINVVVDGIVLAQSIQSAYEGIQAWREGDAHAALDHLFGAVENATFLGMGKRPKPTPAAVEFDGELVPVTGADGQVRLWQPDLDDFAARELPPNSVQPDSAGIYRHAGRAWVRMDGRLHEVDAASGSSHAPLVHPRGHGYTLPLRGDGAGAWRAPYENPAQWESTTLIRRFNPSYEALADSTLIEAQRLAGISDGQLRRAHLDASGTPAPLARLLQYRLAEREMDMAIAALRGSRRPGAIPALLVSALRDLPGWPADRGLAYQEGEATRVLGPSEGTPVQLTDQMLADGTWARRLFAQLGSDATGALLGIETSLVPPEPAYQVLADSWAGELENRRGSLAAELVPDPAVTDAERQTLRRQFPGLTTQAMEALLRGQTGGERLALAAGRVPPAMAELAAESLRQWRVTSALDALAHASFSADRERLAMALWPRLGGWAQSMRLELRNAHFHGALLQEAGGAELPRWVIVRKGERYQAFDDKGLELSPSTSLENALVATVPDDLRQAFTAQVRDAAGLRKALLDLALADRDAVRPLLGLRSDNRHFFRPPTRQANGAVGYALSGRGRLLGTPRGGMHPFVIALRALYPEVSEAEITELRASLGHGEAATVALEALNADFARLRFDLQAWVARARDVVGEGAVQERLARETVSRRIIDVWQRRESAYAIGGLGYGLDLRGLQVRELPTLNVRLPHVQRLTLADMRLSSVNDGFLASFPEISLLDLSFNTLTELPSRLGQLNRLSRLRLDYTGQRSLAQVVDTIMPLSTTLNYLGVAGSGFDLAPSDFELLRRLPQLTSLGLEDNLITLTDETVTGFNQLTRLEELNLAGNPLGRAPALASLHNLRWLEMSQAHLTTFPPELVTLMNRDPLCLLEVDLSENDIEELPVLADTHFVRLARAALDDVESPYYGMSLNLDGNPLSEEGRAELRRSSIPFFEDADMDIAGAQHDPERWLTDCPPALAALIRSERALPEAAEFYQLLSHVVDTADYLNNAAATLGRAWELVETWLSPGQNARPGLEALRERLFSMAQDTQGTCGDGVALTLDEMEFEVEAWRRVADAPGGGDAPLLDLLTYQRGLWRRALVDNLARRITRARVARSAGLNDPDTAPVLDPLDDLPDDALEHGLDEVEVRFYLLERLEGPLWLPPARGMRYTTRVSGATVQRVGVEVLQQDTDEAFATWVAEQPSFRTYLENARVAAFEPLRERWQDAADYLFSASGENPQALPSVPAALDGLRQAMPELQWESGQPLPTLNEQQLRQAYDWISQQRERALDALALTLTRQLLSLEQPGPSGSAR